MADPQLVIERPNEGRTLVLCFDGTAGMYDEKNTNVVQFFALLKKTDRTRQLTYYQSGIGTYLKPGRLTSMLQFFSKLLDQGFAWYLDVHVMGGYEFLMQNYHPGDKICLFGFSRGAYTPRALAGMLYKVGLIPPGNQEQVTFAYKMYKRVDKAAWNDSQGFKRTFSTEVAIDFLGVWDTVSSVGIWWSHYLPFTSSNYMVKTFRHAISLDEHRARYQPNLWHWPPGGKRTIDGEATQNSHLTGIGPDTETTDPLSAPTDVKEVWFAGCHTDVGGGSIENSTPQSLAKITLIWMVRECFLADSGIEFNASSLEAIGLGPTQFSQPHSANSNELKDATSPIHDRLKMRPLWWILEIIPFHLAYENSQGSGWVTRWRVNLGRPRNIPSTPQLPKMHYSVKQRMESGIGYKPGAKWHGALDWTD